LKGGNFNETEERKKVEKRRGYKKEFIRVQ
jgi:hypothetical protein